MIVLSSLTNLGILQLQQRIAYFMPLRIEYLIWKGPHKNIASNSSSTVACVFIAAATCVPSHCLAKSVTYSSTIPDFRSHTAFRSFWGEQTDSKANFNFCKIGNVGWKSFLLVGLKNEWNQMRGPLLRIKRWVLWTYAGKWHTYALNKLLQHLGM
jgi:hypothetical protein